MKLFNTLDMDAVRTSWKQKDNYDLSYYGGKEPAFTPAVQGQVTGMNPNSGIEHYSGLHNVLGVWEFTGWMDECNAISKTGYIGDWSWLNKYRITGPDVISAWSREPSMAIRSFL